MPYLPHLLQFLQSVTKSQIVDPPVFSFSLKLAGLLAGKEHSFTLLEVRMLKVVLVYIMFTCLLGHCVTQGRLWEVGASGLKPLMGPYTYSKVFKIFCFTSFWQWPLMFQQHRYFQYILSRFYRSIKLSYSCYKTFPLSRLKPLNTSRI